MLAELRTVDPDATVDSMSPIAYARVPKDYLPVLEASPDVTDIYFDEERAARR